MEKAKLDNQLAMRELEDQLKQEKVAFMVKMDEEMDGMKREMIELREEIADYEEKYLEAMKDNSPKKKLDDGMKPLESLKADRSESSFKE